MSWMEVLVVIEVDSPGIFELVLRMLHIGHFGYQRKRINCLDGIGLAVLHADDLNLRWGVVQRDRIRLRAHIPFGIGDPHPQLVTLARREIEVPRRDFDVRYVHRSHVNRLAREGP